MLTPLNPEPEITTEVPVVPLVGVNEVIEGSTVNVVALFAEPSDVVTVMYPVVAVEGTTAVI